MRTGLHSDEVPHGLRLAGITTGYRQGGTYSECLWTLFTWHNQTLNSWTMILGWLVSSWLLAWTLTRLHPRELDLTPFLALWLCPTVHLPFTVGYHQFLCISPTVLRRWRALDVAFIFIASIPLTYGLSYFVMPLPYALGLTAVTIGLSLHAWHHAATLPAGAEIDKKANTRYVGYVVLVYTFPILLQAGRDMQQFILYDNSNPGAMHDLPYTFWCAAAITFCFLFGGVTYVVSFPDIYAPGVFDIVGAAQQLMHLAIAGAHAIEWLFVIHMYQRTRGSVAVES
ncbi:hypothetical protein VOLCADRAFT_92076 [Volvox carteri f. nagariensis]|uniref:Uncharacterized protein n=1 Tax=Volvox carteri f. nagariensis TaxID=3068 RepID=D8TYJ2_VOLCA|nr:uncharacterized protein VOLCADRAFT_92076 [Volvox carteri f. nagariensis]EFJ47405.1 hypothetical protein VOLCADRAFT_92076 [Volvox carteri f. nagariensis]|eukprot:XP_002951594.1 hypothetical protein VOLCADRAFT_92076 [Volvox carteri f. nagariensis]